MPPPLLQVIGRTCREFPITIPVVGSPATLRALIMAATTTGGTAYDAGTHDLYLLGGKVCQFANPFWAGHDTSCLYSVDPTKLSEYSENVFDFISGTYVMSKTTAFSALVVVYFSDVPRSFQKQPLP